MNRVVMIFIAATLVAAPRFSAWAQGQDSSPAERDLQVIATLLVGGFDNANQSYFDRRANRDVKHRRLHVDVQRTDASNIGEHVLVARAYHDGKNASHRGTFVFALSTKDRSSVRMRAWALADAAEVESLPATPDCELTWNREAAQFRGSAAGDCGDTMPVEMIVSERQFWLSFAAEGENYAMHRVRNFECYADIPGVGGGRDEPYDRYEGFRLHDMGGEAWFTSKEGRELGISLFLVDWPINNYDGVFTRDSFVIYVSEKTDEGRKELGYAFTVPTADRIGINLKWMLASCYMTSNRNETPSM